MTQEPSKTVGGGISKAHGDVEEWPSGRSKRFANEAAGFRSRDGETRKLRQADPAPVAGASGTGKGHCGPSGRSGESSLGGNHRWPIRRFAKLETQFKFSVSGPLMSGPDGGGWTVTPLTLKSRIGVRSATVFPDVLNGYEGIKARMTSTGDRK